MILKRIESNPDFTIDKYDSFAWVTIYSTKNENAMTENQLKEYGISSAVKILKTKSSLPTNPEIWFGDVPKIMIVEEHGVKYEIHCLDSFHPGLFLDHSLTRKWIKENAADKSILNLFSYTGSLAISGAVGGALKSMSIDLSNTSTQWAKKNAALNSLSEAHQFIKGDVFDWAKRLKKRHQMFDIVVCDPPSQSQSKELHFSTKNHLDLLHGLCIERLAKKGTLITSINTDTVPEKALNASVINISRQLGRKIKDFETLPLPPGFKPDFRSMKGLKVLFD